VKFIPWLEHECEVFLGFHGVVAISLLACSPNIMQVHFFLFPILETALKEEDSGH
jgi:hypothetical protein